MWNVERITVQMLWLTVVLVIVISSVVKRKTFFFFLLRINVKERYLMLNRRCDIRLSKADCNVNNRIPRKVYLILFYLVISNNIASRRSMSSTAISTFILHIRTHRKVESKDPILWIANCAIDHLLTKVMWFRSF